MQWSQIRLWAAGLLLEGLLSYGTPLMASTVPPGGGVTPEHLPYGLKGLVAYPVSYTWVYISLAVLALMLLGGVAWWWQRRPKGTGTAPLHPVLAAEGYIQGLEPSLPFGVKQQGGYFFELSFQVRKFLALVTDMPATHCTMKEFRHWLVKHPTPLEPEVKVLLLRFLERADEIKFRGLEASWDEAAQWHTQIVAWVAVWKGYHPDFKVRRNTGDV